MCRCTDDTEDADPLLSPCKYQPYFPFNVNGTLNILDCVSKRMDALAINYILLRMVNTVVEQSNVSYIRDDSHGML